MRITLFKSYGVLEGVFEIPPFNGYPSAVFLGERIYIKSAHREDFYHEGHCVQLREEDRREGTH